MTVRLATPSDAHAIADVHLYTWQTAYRGVISENYLKGLSIEKYYKKWESRLQKPNVSEYNAFYLVATTDQERVVGFCMAGSRSENRPEDPSELFGIYVLQEHQNKGYGSQLVRTTVQRLISEGYSAMTLWALEKNPYRQFYEKIGGIEINKKKIRIGIRKYTEVEYGWHNLKNLLDSLE
jgi:GNAT superfamily N-acetyltransferase